MVPLEKLANIPFIFCGALNNSPDVDKSPVYDIAEVNIAHYRNSADYEESCFIAGQATPVLTGLTQSIPEIINNLDSEIGKSWKDEFLENFGYGLANVIDILDPDAIILGGGLSNIDFLYSEGKNSVYEKVFSDVVDTPILKNKLGDSSGVFGAALLD